MLKILLIEDLVEKKAEVVSLLSEKLVDFPYHIDYATDANTAKLFIKDNFYDLVIVDLNIPRRDINRSESNAGIDILQFIEINPRAIPPKFIACLTAYTIDSDYINSYPLCHFIQYSITDHSWKNVLTKICSYLKRTHKLPLRMDKRTYHLDVLIVTAIDEEFSAVKQFLKVDSEWESITILGDEQKYAKAIVDTNYGTLTIGLTQASQMGMAAAAVCATKAIEFFSPQCVLMTGICAGVKSKTNYGDIIISDPSFDSGSGKWKVDGDGNLIFHSAQYHLRIDGELKRICADISDDEHVKKKIFSEFNLPENRPNGYPKILVEANASGGSVLQSTVKMEELIQGHKNLVGLEMEVYAVYLAATHSRNPKPKFLSAKSVCDFGTEDKEDSFHTYAAYTSVAFINEFLSKAEFLADKLVIKKIPEYV